MATTAFQSSRSVSTLLAVNNQLMFTSGGNLVSDINTTINYKRGVLTNVDLEALGGALPRVRYFGIGIKGFANLTSENNLAQPYVPSPEHYDLYEPIPFRCVPNFPLSAEEAKDYRMVTTKTIDGIKYYLYWLKKISYENSTISFSKIEGSTETTYTVDATSNLNPAPADLNDVDIQSAKRRIVASISGICKITGTEVLEAINVLYGGDMRRARVSEIGLYAGVEVSLDAEGDLPARVEAAYTQLYTHECNLGELFPNEGHVHVRRVSLHNGADIA